MKFGAATSRAVAREHETYVSRDALRACQAAKGTD